MSCKVVLSAWPICREPVTFGGGMTIVKGAAPARSGRPARKAPAPCHAEAIRPSTALGSKVFSIIGSLFRCRSHALGGPAGAGRVKWSDGKQAGKKQARGGLDTRRARPVPQSKCDRALFIRRARPAQFRR